MKLLLLCLLMDGPPLGRLGPLVLRLAMWGYPIRWVK